MVRIFARLEVSVTDPTYAASAIAAAGTMPKASMANWQRSKSPGKFGRLEMRNRYFVYRGEAGGK